MAVFEVQFDVAAFLRAQRSRLRSERFCPPPPISLGPLGTEVQIQRVEFGENEIRRGPSRIWNTRYISQLYGSPPQYLAWTAYPAEGFAVHIAQHVRTHTSSFHAVREHPNAAPPQLDDPIEAVLVFETDYFPFFDEGCKLKLELERVEWPSDPNFLGLPADAVKTAIETFASTAFKARVIPFNFTTLVPPSFPEVVNAGVSLSADMTVIAFRADPFGTPSGNSDGPWTNFFRGLFDNRLAGKDWAFLTDVRLICATIALQVETALRSNPIPETLVDAVSATYQMVGGAPVITAHVGVYATVPVLGKEYFNFHIPCTISLESTPPALVFDIDLSDIANQTSWVGLFVERLRWVFPPLGWTLELAFADELSKLRSLPAGVPLEPASFVCETITAAHRRCRRPAEIPAIPDLRIKAQAISAYPDGFAVNGAIVGTELPQGVLHLEPGQFSWSPHSVSCSSPDSTIQHARERPQDFAYLYLECLIESASATSAAHLCSLEVINDPLNLYPKPGPQLFAESAQLPTKLIVRMDAPPTLPDYPLDIIVRTSAGVQLLRIAPPLPFSDGDAILVSGAIEAQLLACPMLPAWWGKLKDGFDLNWIVDPLRDPDPDLIVGHRIKFNILEAPGPDLSIEIGDAFVKTFAPMSDAWNGAVIAPSGSRTRLRAAVDPRRAAERMASVDIDVAPLRALARLDMEEPIQTVSLGARDGKTMALIATRSGLALAEFSGAGLLGTTRRRRLSGIRGALAVATGNFAWTDGQSFLFDQEFCERDLPNLGRVRAAAASASHLYIANHRGIEAIDLRSWRATSVAPLEQAAALAVVGDRLVAGGDFGIAVAPLRGREPLAFQRVGRAPPIVFLKPTIGAAGSVTARTVEGEEIEFDFDRADMRTRSLSKGEPIFREWDVLDNYVIYMGTDTDLVCVAELGSGRPVVPATDS
jgi:hypothetical protein